MVFPGTILHILWVSLIYMVSLQTEMWDIFPALLRFLPFYFLFYFHFTYFLIE